MFQTPEETYNKPPDWIQKDEGEEHLLNNGNKTDRIHCCGQEVSIVFLFVCDQWTHSRAHTEIAF
jgi:hypothetical protein